MPATHHKWKKLKPTRKGDTLYRRCETCGVEHRSERRGSREPRKGYNIDEFRTYGGAWQTVRLANPIPACAGSEERSLLGMIRRQLSGQYVIFNVPDGCYWKSDARGYAANLLSAGFFSLRDAESIAARRKHTYADGTTTAIDEARSAVDEFDRVLGEDWQALLSGKGL